MAKEEDLALIDRLYAAFGARDSDAFRQLCAPEIRWEQSAGFPGGRTYTGAEEVIAGVFERNDGLWENFRFRLDTMHADGDGNVFVLGSYTGTGRETGESFSAAVTHIYSVAGGLVQRFRMYADTHTIQRSLMSSRTGCESVGSFT